MTDEIGYIGPARSFDELVAAWRLAQQAYVRAGFATETDAGLRFSLLDLVSPTVTFVGYVGGTVAATTSGVLDTSAGLPSSIGFGPAFAEYQRLGRIMVEGTRFAANELVTREHPSLAHILFNAVIWWAVHQGADDYFIVCNPRHTSHYTRTFGFTRIWSSESCSWVSGNPGDLLHLALGVNCGEGAILPRGIKRYGLGHEHLRRIREPSYGLTDIDRCLLLISAPEVYEESTREAQSELRRRFSTAGPSIQAILRHTLPLIDILNVDGVQLTEFFDRVKTLSEFRDIPNSASQSYRTAHLKLREISSLTQLSRTILS